MSFFGFIKDLISPVTKLVDDISTTDEEKLQLRNALEKIQSEFGIKALEIEGKAIEAQSKALELQNQVLLMDGKSDHFLQWSWRPVGCYWSYVMITLHAFGKVQIPEVGLYAIGALLGITSFTRGKEKEFKAKKK